MNDTKWKELFQIFYELECSRKILTQWQTKSLTGYIHVWNNTWSHFGCEPAGYRDIEWLKIRFSTQDAEAVIQILKDIHVPGEVSQDCAIIYGHKPNADYI